MCYSTKNTKINWKQHPIILATNIVKPSFMSHKSVKHLLSPTPMSSHFLNLLLFATSSVGLGALYLPLQHRLAPPHSRSSMRSVSHSGATQPHLILLQSHLLHLPIHPTSPSTRATARVRFLCMGQLFYSSNWKPLFILNLLYSIDFSLIPELHNFFLFLLACLREFVMALLLLVFNLIARVFFFIALYITLTCWTHFSNLGVCLAFLKFILFFNTICG